MLSAATRGSEDKIINWSDFYRDARYRKEAEKELTGDTEYRVSPYIAQIGLQGLVIGYVTKLLPLPKHYNYMIYRCGCIAAFDFVLLLICLQIKRRYGILLAGCFLAVSFGSPWLALFSANLYWVAFTWLLPMLLGLLCLNCPRKRFFFYPLFYLSIVLKTMCGYEYISTIMVGAISFMCTEWIARKEERKKLTGMILAVGIACLLGFATTFAVHGYIAGSGDIAAGMRSVYQDVAMKRLGSYSASIPEAFRESLETPVLVVVFSYLWHGFAGKAALLIFLVTMVCLVLQWKWHREKNTFDIALLIVNIFGTISWYVLCKGHSYIHTHINFVLWYMGSMQTAVYITVKAIYNHRSDISCFWNGQAKESE